MTVDLDLSRAGSRRWPGIVAAAAVSSWDEAVAGWAAWCRSAGHSERGMLRAWQRTFRCRTVDLRCSDSEGA
jgi:hypothetical protein